MSYYVDYLTFEGKWLLHCSTADLEIAQTEAAILRMVGHRVSINGEEVNDPCVPKQKQQSVRHP